MIAAAPVRPLADRLRPQRLTEVLGQDHLLAPGKPLHAVMHAARLHSMVLWGPPGTGKTTLARLLAQGSGARFISLSAVLAGVKEIRAAVTEAETERRDNDRATVLFVDEVHRFHKGQQDAFLPYVEDGTITFIGATTENPSFSLNNALLSRLRVYLLQSLDDAALGQLLVNALQSPAGLGQPDWQLSSDDQRLLIRAADGDARRILTLLEVAADLAGDGDHLSSALRTVVNQGPRRFDRDGDDFYDQISALHKAVRGSNPDGALYWYCRMLDGGADPHYIARRVLRIAAEDIGNADPRGLGLALDAWEGYRRLGSPEGELLLAQAIVYLACAAKSDAVYTAFKAAQRDVAEHGSLAVPLQLRNAPTALGRELGHGRDYRHAHDEPDGYAAGECYFPDALGERHYYRPVARGLEIKIAEKLAHLRRLDARQRGSES